MVRRGVGTLGLAVLFCCGGGAGSGLDAGDDNIDSSMTADAAGSPSAPVILYDGPQEAGARVPDWDPALAGAMIIFAQSLSTSQWWSSIGQIEGDGLIDVVVSDGRALIWGWPTRAAAGAPERIFRGPAGSVLISDWNHPAPPPILALSVSDQDPAVMVAYLSIDETGDASTIIFPTLEVFSWSSGGPALLYDGPAGGVVPGWDQDTPRPLVVMQQQDPTSGWNTVYLQFDTDGTIMGDAQRVLIWSW